MAAIPNIRDTPYRIVVPDEDWKPLHCNSDDAADHLITAINVCGTMMHLEAYAVENEIQDEQTLVNETVADALSTLTGDDCSWPLQTTTIAGRKYVLVATPFGN